MVFGHAIQANITDGVNYPLWSDIIVNFQMPFLFAISGYSIGFGFPSSDVCVYIKKKASRLFLPYIMWAYIHYFLVALIPGNYRVLGMNSLILEIFISDFWFLRMLFFFFLLIAFANAIANIMRFQDEKKIYVLIILIGMGMNILAGRIPFLKESASGWYFAWFMIGYAYNLFDKKVELHGIKNSNILGIFSVLVILVTTWCTLARGLYLPQKLVAIIYALMLTKSLSWGSKLLPDKIVDFVSRLGKNTLPIYAIHWCLLFSPIWRMGIYNRIFESVPIYISGIITACVWTGICIAIIEVFKKNKYTRKFLLGQMISRNLE